MVLSPFFQILMASLIHLLYLLLSVPKTFASSRPMTWFVSTIWSVIADLFTLDNDTFLPILVTTVLLAWSASFLCSPNLMPNCLPVSPTLPFHSFCMEFHRWHRKCSEVRVYLWGGPADSEWCNKASWMQKSCIASWFSPHARKYLLCKARLWSHGSYYCHLSW